MAYDDIKIAGDGKTYSGVRIGAGHEWDYPHGVWKEEKVTPDKWKFSFSSSKLRHTPAPEGSGVPLQTSYFWHIFADQVVTKVSANEYHTMMEGLKLKVGHKRPYWRDWSFNYQNQKDNHKSYEDRLIAAHKEEISRLELEMAEEMMKNMVKEKQ